MNPHPLLLSTLYPGGFVMESFMDRMIEWEFANRSSSNLMRYGKVNETYYAQFVPLSGVNNGLYPPRTIEQRIYLAARQLNKKLGVKLPSDK